MSRKRRSVMSDQLKNELAKDLGFYETVKSEGWGGIKAKDAGNMVKRAIQLAEQAAAKQLQQQQHVQQTGYAKPAQEAEYGQPARETAYVRPAQPTGYAQSFQETAYVRSAQSTENAQRIQQTRYAQQTLRPENAQPVQNASLPRQNQEMRTPSVPYLPPYMQQSAQAQQPPQYRQ